MNIQGFGKKSKIAAKFAKGINMVGLSGTGQLELDLKSTKTHCFTMAISFEGSNAHKNELFEKAKKFLKERKEEKL